MCVLFSEEPAMRNFQLSGSLWSSFYSQKFLLVLQPNEAYTKTSTAAKQSQILSRAFYLKEIKTNNKAITGAYQTKG